MTALDAAVVNVAAAANGGVASASSTFNASFPASSVISGIAGLGVNSVVPTSLGGFNISK